MNYFLILGIIVMVVSLLILLLNSISKVVQQSEQKDVLFTILFLILDLSILVIFVITIYSLQKDYNANLTIVSSSYMIDYDVKAKTETSIMVVDNDELINVQITDNTKYINNSEYSGKIKIEVSRIIAPDVWYMMDWQVEALNKTVIYTADVIYI